MRINLIERVFKYSFVSLVKSILKKFVLNLILSKHEIIRHPSMDCYSPKEEKKLTTSRILCILLYYPLGRVVESVDTMDLKSIASNTSVRVQVPPRPHLFLDAG